MAKITIEVGNLKALELQAKTKQLEVIAKQDSKVLDKLVLMSKSKTAINYLNENWSMLKSMLSI